MIPAEAYVGICTAAMSSLWPCTVASPQSFKSWPLLDDLHMKLGFCVLKLQRVLLACAQLQYVISVALHCCIS